MNISIEIIFITLVTISILLLILSFLKKDRITEVEKQLESLTMQVMQENYQLKKRMKLLEEELLGGDDFSDRPEEKVNMSANDNINQQEIIKLLQTGYKNKK